MASISEVGANAERLCTSSTEFGVLQACALAACVLIPFVGLFYVSPAWISELPRDHPHHVIYRLTSVSVSSVLSSLVFYFVIQDGGPTLACYGLEVQASDPLFWWRNVAVPVLLVLCLYGAEIVYRARSAVLLQDCHTTLLANVNTDDPLLMFRNILFAPLIEEFTFRCLIVRAFRLVGSGLEGSEGGSFSTTQLVLITPLFFSAAHIHHVYRLHWVEGHALGVAILNVGVMCAYTYLFGMFATFLLLRCGSIFAPFAAHLVCNSLGLPSLAFLNTQDPANSWRHGLLLLHIVCITLFGFWVYTLAVS